MTTKTFALGLAAAAMIAGGASATTISISTFDATEYAALTASGIAVGDHEDFEGFAGHAGVWDPTTVTSVGTFSTLGVAGSGTVCTINTGCAEGLGIQTGDLSGQGNIVPLGGVAALSSNDTTGIIWNAATASGGLFKKLIFAVRDAAELGTREFRVTANGVSQSIFAEINSNTQTVVINFSTAVSSALVEARTSKNDGFTLDGATIAPIPLPASSLLLLGGLAALGAAARRKKAVKA